MRPSVARQRGTRLFIGARQLQMLRVQHYLCGFFLRDLHHVRSAATSLLRRRCRRTALPARGRAPEHDPAATQPADSTVGAQRRHRIAGAQ
ncbi:hypothetical protein XFF6166_670124 [Xanthomonas citri pv. fuscans]|nr:hypothetical protein XFF6166_670124 [Xanthomonas citri pv. fuscans]SOO01753.1 hypothetical protein XFF6960_520123 [Xanthomonas citri pv. fuscans]SOO04230.1 hypothetical protein XFF7767_240071 [Xanthomonas citri pv. fuscans]SOO08374.1 hypothetical protein XFF6970_210028 [Xanthomonas citri pv. fuscans]SOO16652.1 hypothetical protein XFF7766_850071 [Xanthomonas citri pv. fuscans]